MATREQEIYLEQINLLYHQLKSSLVATMVVASLAVLVLWEVSPHDTLLQWLAAMAAVLACRAGLLVAFNRTKPNAENCADWGKLFLIGSTTTGVIWGAVSILFVNEISLEYQLTIGIIIFGICSGAVAPLSTLRSTFILYIVSSMAPLSLYLGLSDFFTANVVSFALLVAMVFFIKSAGSIYQNIYDNIRLRLESIDKEKDLLIANEQAEMARKEAESANRLKGTFLATMSHEIRTPMNGVIGMNDLLLNTDLTAEQKDLCLTIADSAESLLKVINDILDFSKVEAGKMELDAVPTDLRVCIERAFDVISSRANEKNLNLAYLIEPGTVEEILADGDRIRQILLNILSNALKFTEQGEVVLHVASVKAEQAAELLADGCTFDPESANLHFSVRDTGIGIPEDKLGKLFQSFSQVDASTTRRYGGTGLGLAISKNLVNMMAGRIWVESEPDKGTTFHFTISVPRTEISRKNKIHEPKSDLTHRKMLIVDDNATNRKILSMHAQEWSMDFEATQYPSEALEWIKAGKQYDVAILDMSMPDTSGVDLAGQIRQEPSTSDLPLVLLSSISVLSDDENERLKQANFHASLSKPIKPSVLLDVLMDIFEISTDHGKTESPAKETLYDKATAEQYPLNILLVDDNKTNRKLGAMVLGRLGYQVDLANNGIEAVERQRQERYDLILMDIEMPQLDGVEATLQIRQLPDDAREAHIIAMTANAMEGDRERYIEAGMDGYISKPMRIEALLEGIRAAAESCR